MRSFPNLPPFQVLIYYGYLLAMSEQSVMGKRYDFRIKDAIKGIQGPRKLKGRGRKLRYKNR